MKRREFLLSVAMSAAPFLPSAGQAREAGGKKVMTVLGPLDAGRLGRTLMHEHVLVDFVGADKIRPERYSPDEVFAKALPFLKELKSAGCATLLDCTPAYLGRDPGLLARLSRASGLHILTNTGIYGAAHERYVPSYAFDESAERLAARWVREAREGIRLSGIKPGFIKIGVNGAPLSAVDAKLVTAAGLTHLETGLLIASHTANGAAAMAQLATLQSLRVSPSAFIWVHAQNERDSSLHRRAAELGAWVEFDGIGPGTIPQSVEQVMEMKNAGGLERVLVSQDSGWYHVGEPGGGAFQPYTTIFSRFLPALVAAGAEPRDLETLLVENPRRALAPH